MRVPYLIFFAPLVGAVFAGLLLKMRPIFSQIATTTSILTAFLSSAYIAYNILILDNGYSIELMQFLSLGTLKTFWSIHIDALTAIMLIVVLLVSFVVHVYSIVYMHDDPHNTRFFAYLSLFTFFMIVLVCASDFIQLFVGWEGVGVCSYLLIGFWFNKESANLASMKAFIVNRVGDLSLVVAICAIYYIFGTLNFSQVFDEIAISGMPEDIATFIGMALFIGAMGKSAQIGLHTWLPDAMEGPTPVSALIHAATMVTAGIFLMAKCSIFLEFSPITRAAVTLVGAITCIFAASIALTQTDIKKIIAYSTCSQLGYMFFGIGTMAAPAAIFHLATHAFFKALLFLSAGSVIHAFSGEQNIFKMGSATRAMPFTFMCFMVGSLAIAGVFPFAGYFSKDAILESAFAYGTSGGDFGFLAYAMGLTAVFMTSFYSWRLIILVFHRKNDHVHPHESSKLMLFALLILVIPSICAGFLGDAYHILSPEFWHGALAMSDEKLESMHHLPSIVKFAPSVVSIFAIALAYFIYLKKPNFPMQFAGKFTIPYKLSFNKYYIDELYNIIFVIPCRKLSSFFINYIDTKVIDRLIPHGFTFATMLLVSISKKIHSGKIFTYLSVIIAFIVLLFIFLVLGIKI